MVTYSTPQHYFEGACAPSRQFSISGSSESSLTAQLAFSGSGGCCRLPLLIGLQNALGMLLTGKPVNSRKAHQLGLVDHLITKTQSNLSEEDLSASFGWYKEVKELWASGKFLIKGQGMMDIPERIIDMIRGTSNILYKYCDKKARVKYPKHLFGNTWLEQQVIYYIAHQRVCLETQGNFSAPLICLQAVFQAWRAGTVQEALHAEARGYSQAVITSQAKSFMGLFLNGTKARKEASDYTANQSVMSGEKQALQNSTVKKVVVIGSGEHVPAITQCLLYSKFCVSLCIPEESFKHTLDQITELYQLPLSKKLLTQLEVDRQMSTLEVDTEAIGGNLKSVVTNIDIPDVLVLCLDGYSDKETVKFWEGIEKYYYTDHDEYEQESEVAVIPVCAVVSSPRTTNVIKSVCKNPDMIVGVEVFNPKHRKSLCAEIICRNDMTTSSTAVRKVAQIFNVQGKTPVLTHCLDEHSVGVHIAVCGWAAAGALAVKGGVSINDIDTSLKEFGYEQGMFEQMDEIGLDTVLDLCSKTVQKASQNCEFDPKHSMCSSKLLQDVIAKLIRKGCHGKCPKSSVSEGFYQWKQGKRAKINFKLTEVLKEVGEGQNLLSRDILNDAIVLVIICEALYLTSQGMTSASHVDLLSVLGFAKFPPFLGGPIKCAETWGFENIVDRVKTLKKIGLIDSVPSVLIHFVGTSSDLQSSKFYPGWPRCEGVSKKVVLSSVLPMSKQQMFGYLSFLVILQAIFFGFIHSKL